MISVDVQYTRKLIAYTPLLILLGFSTLLIWQNFDSLVYVTYPKISKPIIETKEDQKLAPAGMKVAFKTTKIGLNKNSQIYKNSIREQLSDTRISNIVSVLGLNGFQVQSDAVGKNWKKDNAVLNIDSSGMLYYTDYLDKAKLSGLPSIDVTQAKAYLKNYFQKLGFNSDFIDFYYPEETLFFEQFAADREGKLNIPPNNANYVRFTYPIQINKNPFVGVYPIKLKVYATFARGYTLVNLITPIILGKWEQDIKYPGLSEYGIKRELERGKATLVKYDPVIHKAWPKIDPIKTLEITSIKSAYLYSTTDYQYLVPIYIIEADGATEPGTQVKTTFYLPAFSSALFK